MPADPENPAPAPESISPDVPLTPESQEAVDAGLPPISPDEVEQEMGDQMDNAVPSYGYGLTPIVGLGGSAGSIAALGEFFAATAPDAGLAYVVVLHLSAEHESALPAILGRHTAMPVVQVKDGAKIEKDHVYIIPPGKYLSSTDGHLRLTPLEPERGKRMAVDVFFRTLADTHGAHAAAIVLSGADGDGAIGLRRIKERGGLTIAQDPDEAEHHGMPRSAINTGMVDWILRVPQMPGQITEYFEREKRLRLPTEAGHMPGELGRPTPDVDETALRDVLIYLRTRTGRDFTYYKRATVLRRIGRRMQITGSDTLTDYLNFLRTHPGESGALLQDMLISVTNFFRDRDAFSTLETTIPLLFEGKGPNDSVRVWVPACATGEEAYSVAILLHEHARTLEMPPTIQIFATDLAEDAVTSAREGLYTAAIATDVSEERLRRFFTRDQHGYRVRREIREGMLFALHDVLKDSPFSRLDMITCRNLLIYFNRDAQRRALDVFHFALRTEGTLFLGTSETVEDTSDLFRPLDKKYRLYRRRSVPRQPLALPLGEPTFARSALLRERASENRVAAPVVPTPLTLTIPTPRTEPTPPPTPPGGGELFLQIFEHLGPPALIVDHRQQIIHLSGTAFRYLQFGVGAPTTSLLQAVHPTLRLELRAALLRAEQTGAPAAAYRLHVELPQGAETVDLQVVPALDVAPDHYLILINPHAAEGGVPALPAPVDPAVRQVERELENTRAHLRDVGEQYEASLEEQKAGNEELQAMNEELRSASEELETSREELQSINEEMGTVNQELKSKVEDLAEANSDLQNLIASTNIATVFLDRQLRVTRFTPTAVPLFNLISTDVGRPLTDLQQRFDYPEMEADATRVLVLLAPVEREVGQGKDGWFLARVLPYRTADDRIAGVVLTFVDITARKQIEERVSRSEEQFRLFVKASSDTVYKMSPDWREMRSLEGNEFLVSTDQPSGVWLEQYIPRSDRPAVLAAIQDAIHEKRLFELEHRVIRADRTVGWMLSRAVPLLNPAGEIVEWFGTARDVTESREAQNALRESEARLATINNVVPSLLFSTDAGGRLVWCNQRWTDYTGQSLEQAQGYGWASTILPEDHSRAQQGFLGAVAEGRPFRSEHRLLAKDGSARWFLVQVEPLRDEAGRVIGWFGAKSDIDDFKNATAKRLDSEERLRLAAAAAGLGTCDWSYQTNEARWNEQRFRLYGLEPHPERLMRVDDFLSAVHPEDRARVQAEVKAGVESLTGEHAEEYRVQWPDGTVRWIAESGRVVERDEAGRPKRVISVLFDITDRREAERTVRESEERLRLIFDSAQGMGIFTLDPQGGITSWNAGAEQLFGWSAAEAAGRPVAELLPEEVRDRGALERHTATAAREGRCEYEEWFLRRDGSRFWSSGVLSPLRDAEGQVTGFLKIMRDRTDELQAREGREYMERERARMLEVAQAARREAEEASAAKDQFLAVLSHELRTPLTPITMALGMLADRTDLPPRVREALEMIERNVELESGFIDDLLDVTRISRGKMEIVRTDMDLHVAARRAVEVTAQDLQAKSQRLEVDLSASDHVLRGDFARLQQAMWNLLRNASKFTPEGGTISLRTHNKDGLLCVEVADSGIGIEKEALTRIFNAFEQADMNISKEFGGLGLGLAIAKATVDAHGGELRAESAGRNRGATFTILLPLENAENSGTGEQKPS